MTRNVTVVEKVEYLIIKDRRLTALEIAEQVEINTSILYDYAQKDCEICSQASVRGTEDLLLTVELHLLDTINAEAGFFRFLVPKTKMPLK
ncbi:hypothetical protein TNCV_2716531 [Trichonephila clavipes]|nr:hypothetical protein TNCV_2716531 [Trichonephila clavipes]